MKSLLIALFLSVVPMASGTVLRLDTVSLPLYLHGADTDPRIAFQAVPFVTAHSDPEWRFAAISKPFVPPSDGASRANDVNMTSLYGIRVAGNYKENGTDMVVTIDASKAAQPDGYPFTVEQVIDAVTTCVKLMFPPHPPEEGTLEIVITRPAKKAVQKPK